ncbi:MAG: bacteriocin [Paracoccus sp. (in: a-proteobacteria)]|nr:bacteriocin [Paracoccus sp. (in: a-proteobacteria)]
MNHVFKELSDQELEQVSGAIRLPIPLPYPWPRCPLPKLPYPRWPLLKA